MPPTDIAFSTAARVTFAGSMIPSLSISPKVSLAASYPWLPVPSRTPERTTAPSAPELSAITLIGSSRAFLRLLTAVLNSELTFSFSRSFEDLIKTVPPPGTIPS